MLAAGIKTPVPLEELESHLREEIERQMKSGLSEQTAFEISVRQAGQPKALKREFKKSERIFMKRIVIIMAALFGMVMGGGMILPALGRWHHTGSLLLPPLLMETALLAVGAGVSVYGIKTYKETRGRRLVSLGIFATGTFFVRPCCRPYSSGRLIWQVGYFASCSRRRPLCSLADAIISTDSIPSNARRQERL